MTKPEQFLSQRQRYQPISLPQSFSDEQMVKDWTLTELDREEIGKYRKNFRLFIAVQICSVRLYGRFLNPVHDLSPRIVNYLGQQLSLPPSLAIEGPERKATYTEHRQNILQHLGFGKFDEAARAQLETWLEKQAGLGLLPEELFEKAEHYLLDCRILLPGPSVMERLIIHVCSTVHQQLFESVFRHLSPELRQAIDHLLKVPEGEQRSYFHYLKAYPPAATISSIQSYLERYQTVAATGIDHFEGRMLTPAFLDYLFKQAKRYSAKDLKRFADHKRYDKVDLPPAVSTLQKVIDARLPSIRIEQLLVEVDRLTHFSRHFTPIQGHQSRPSHFYRTFSLKKRTAPAHVIVQRLTNSFPADRLSKAFTNLGRILKTQYILRYLTDPALRQTVQLQLNKGEYRHKLPRRIFFADQGEFTTGDYEEIMNKASCLSLVSNAILYWNTLKIHNIVESLRAQGERIEDETLSHISLLPFKHVVPNGTYFIDDL